MSKITPKNGLLWGRFYFIVLLILVSNVFVKALSQNKTTLISYKQAQEIAQKYVSLPAKELTRSTSQHIHLNTNSAYYIFNDALGKGFVVVSGNTKMGEILAYSTTDVLDTLNANPGIKFFLEAYRQRFNEEMANPRQEIAMPQATETSKEVSPLLTSVWGQGAPYNIEAQYPYTGCVATAISQLMFFYKFPLQGKGKQSYHIAYYKVDKSVNFAQSRYDWDNMLPSYQYPVRATAIQEKAVAHLMSDVGIACLMQYAPHYSGSYSINAFKALENNFNYQAVYLSRAVEGSSRFASIIKQEISNGYPVYMSGSPAGGGAGHAWVVDGIDKNGLFHMNFGWEGQSNSYYSLTALSLLNTGSEFNGRPLAFNRGLEAVLARPNNGSYPAYDKALLYSSPRISFNSEGSFTLSPLNHQSFLLQDNITASLSHFVNKGLPFKGDIGIAVLNETKDIVSTTYSEDHNNGGFTQREYGNLDGGVMKTNYLMNREQRLNLSFSTLTNGIYTLIPVVSVQNEDGSWNEPIEMINVPEIVIEVKDGKANVIEEASQKLSFQQRTSLQFLSQGAKESDLTTSFAIRNLSGVSKDAFLTMLLLDNNQQVVYKTHSSKPILFAGFSITEVPLSFSLPAYVPTNTYNIKLVLSVPDAQGRFTETPQESFEVKNIAQKEPQTFMVLPEKEKPLMQQVQFSITDNAEEDLPSNSLTLTQWSQFKFKIRLKTTEGKAYSSPIAVYLQEKDGRERIKLNGFINTETISSQRTTSLLSYWYRSSNLPLAEGKTYKIEVMATQDGKEKALIDNTNTTYFLTLKGRELSVSTEVSTGISPVEVSVQVPLLHNTAQTLTISAPQLHQVSIYNLQGMCLKNIITQNNNAISIAKKELSSGVYVLIIKTKTRHFTQKILIE